MRRSNSCWKYVTVMRHEWTVMGWRGLADKHPLGPVVFQFYGKVGTEKTKSQGEFLCTWQMRVRQALDLTGISVRSQVRILYVMKKKNGINEIWCFCSPGIPLGFWAKILWSRGFTKNLESQLHGSQRKSYLSVPFFFYLRCEWLVRGCLYMPGQRYES